MLIYVYSQNSERWGCTMLDILQSQEFIEWFSNVREIVSDNCLTEHKLDKWDFLDHFIDGYSELESIEEYFDFTPHAN